MEDKITSVTIDEDAGLPTQIEQANPIAEQYEVSVDTPEFDAASNNITMDEIVVGETAGDVTETVEIEIEEAMGWAGGDNTRHDNLTGRDEENQHPIKAIIGLQTILDRIETLKTVYSDKHNIANYYKWQDKAYDECGYFVSLVPEISEIKICDGSDIFGVSVAFGISDDGVEFSEAGFIGNQDADVPRDNSYGLIVTSGLVDVRCELDIEVGDYVISNSRGYATKSATNCGYKVLAREKKDGTEYALIALGVQADSIYKLSTQLDATQEQAESNRKNIFSAINTATQAYNKSAEAASVSEEAVLNALKALKQSEETAKEVESANKTAQNASVVAAQARAIADSAVTEATTLKNEAVTRANDAWAKADEVQKETYSLCAKIDKHSVGEYSQAYGLTLDQAKSILEIGMIYVPTSHEDSRTHTEEYSYEVDDETKTYERTFVPGYLYEWREIPGSEIGIGWVTVDRNYDDTTETDADETNPINTSAMAVYFSGIEVVVGDNNNYTYWYTDSQDVAEGYEPYTLYHWEDDHWIAVATLQGNASNRMVSEVYQTTNEIMMSVINPRGGIAGFDAKLTDTESTTQQLSAWKNGKDESQAIIYQKTDGDEASIVISTLKTRDGETKETSLVLTANEDGSALCIDADNILLNGTTAFTTTDSSDGTTKIDGGNIATGTISADHINAEELFAKQATIGGWSITGGGLEKSFEKDNITYQVGIYSSLYDSDGDGFGEVDASTTFWIESKNEDTGTATPQFYVRPTGEMFARNANIAGRIAANNGSIGCWSVGTIPNPGNNFWGNATYTNSLYTVSASGQNIGITDETTLNSQTSDCYLAFLRLPSGDSSHVMAIRHKPYKDGAFGDVETTFSVAKNGHLYAHNADITGKISADSGRIGRWNITTTGTIQDYYQYGEVSRYSGLRPPSTCSIAQGAVFAISYTDPDKWEEAAFYVDTIGSIHLQPHGCPIKTLVGFNTDGNIGDLGPGIFLSHDDSNGVINSWTIGVSQCCIKFTYDWDNKTWTGALIGSWDF